MRNLIFVFAFISSISTSLGQMLPIDTTLNFFRASFTFNGETFKVFGSSVGVYVRNMNSLPIYEYENAYQDFIRRVIYTTDCPLELYSPIDMNDAFLKVRAVVESVLSKRRRIELNTHDRYGPGVSLVVDHTCRVRDVSFALAGNTIVTQQELYEIERRLKQLVLKKNNPPCNFDYMVVNTPMGW